MKDSAKKDSFDFMPSPNKRKLYLSIGVFVVIVVIIIILLSSFGNNNSTLSSVDAKLEDSKISSGSTTYLLVKATNIGTTPLAGKFSVAADDPESVHITYPNNTLLEFYLLEGESVERRLAVTAVSKAKRTDFEVSLTVEDLNGTVIGKDMATLTVTR